MWVENTVPVQKHALNSHEPSSAGVWIMPRMRA